MQNGVHMLYADPRRNVFLSFPFKLGARITVLRVGKADAVIFSDGVNVTAIDLHSPY